MQHIQTQSEVRTIQENISKKMSSITDNFAELGGQKMNNEAIQECLNFIHDAKTARKRYNTQAIVLEYITQILVLVTTIYTVLELYCRNSDTRYCKNSKNEVLFSVVIIVCPVLAAIFQTLIYTFRPKWKKARLYLLEKRLESEMYKFRARVGPYNVFASRKQNSSVSVRDKFVTQCQQYYNVCVQSEFKSGTMNPKDGFIKGHLKYFFRKRRSRITVREEKVEKDINDLEENSNKKYRLLDIDDYKEERLYPQYEKFQLILPRVILWRNILQTTVIILTSGSTLLGALPPDDSGEVAFLIPALLGLAAFCNHMLSFFRYEALAPVLHEECVAELANAKLACNKPATLEKCLHTQKEEIVFMVEDAVLSYYIFLADYPLGDKEKSNEGQNAVNGEDKNKETSEENPRKNKVITSDVQNNENPAI